MKKRIISIIIILSFLFSDIPLISKITFATEDVVSVDEYITETEPTVVTQNIAPENVNWEDFEDEENEQVLNTRENYDLSRSSLVNSNKTLWEELMSLQFGESFFNPYKKKSSMEITGDLNSLSITETDLSLPGKNGLDLIISRIYDSRNTNSFPVASKTDFDVMSYVMYAYRFNASNGEVVDILFSSYDEFYIYMFDGCYVTDLNVSSDASPMEGVNLALFHSTVSGKRTTSASGIKLTYDSSVPSHMYIIRDYANYELYDISLTSKYTSISNGWSYNLPSAVARCDEKEKDSNSTVSRVWRYYSGVFTDIDGVIHTYSSMHYLTTVISTQQTTFQSSYSPDNGDQLSYVRYYENQTLEDGTIYNFVATDKYKKLTYYLFDTYGAIASSQNARIVKIVNDYGDNITFNYPETGRYPLQIVDTYGREVTLSSSGISYSETPDSDDREIKYSTYTIPAEKADNESILKNKALNRFIVTNEEGEQTIYDGRVTNTFAFYQPSNTFYADITSHSHYWPSTTCSGFNLERIIYPTGMEKHFLYDDVYLSTSQSRILRQLYSVASTWEVNDGNVINKVDYTISGVNGRTIVGTRNDDGRVVTRKFDSKGRMTQDYLTESGNGNIIKGSRYSYDSYDNITQEVTYNTNKQKVTNYGYARRGVMNKYATSGIEVSWSYYNSSHLPSYIVYHNPKDSSKSYSITNTFLEDHFKIATSTTTNGSDVIAKTAYEYDSEGNVILEKQWLSDDDSNNILDENDSFIVFNKNTSLDDDLLLNVTDSVENVVDANGTSVGTISEEYKYNVRGNPLYKIDGLGNITSITYDGASRPVKYTYPNSNTKEIDYSISDRQIIVMDELGVKHKYLYNALGKEAGKYIYSNNEWKPEYLKEYDTVAGRLSKYTVYTAENTGTITTYTYDVADRVLTENVQEFNGNSELKPLYNKTYSYTGNSSYLYETITTKYDDVTVSTKSTYDSFDRLISQEISDGTSTYITSYQYDWKDRVVKTTNPDGSISTAEYDSFDNCTSVTDALGNTMSYSYDMAGRKVSETDFDNNIAYFTYDSLGRNIKTELPFDDGHTSVTKLFYDNGSRIIKEMVQSNSPNEEEKYSEARYEYDNMGNVTAAIQENGDADVVTLYDYTPSGQISKMATGLNSPLQNVNDGAVTTYSYNSLGQLDKVIDPLGQEVSYAYDYLGNQLSAIDRNGTVITNTYGAFGVSETNAQKGNKYQTVKNEYDGIGNLIKISDYKNGATNSRIEYKYDAFGRKIEELDGYHTKQYSYDEMSNLISFKLFKYGSQSSHIQYEYDALGRLTQLNNSGNITSYTYDNNSNLLSKKRGGIKTEFQYNNANLVTSMTNTNNYKLVSRYTCEYSLDGNKTKETSSDGVIKSYMYDSVGRLTNENWTGSESNSFSYTYDLFGNRSSANINNELTTYEYDKNNRLLSTHTGNGGKIYNYDNNGNQILVRDYADSGAEENLINVTTSNNAGFMSYEYDLFNRLTNAVDASNSCQYTYYPDGLRKSKTVNGQVTDFSWSNGNLVSESTRQTQTLYEYDILGISAMKTKDGTSYYFKNPHGDVTSLLDQNGNIKQSYSYDAFGNQQNESDVVNLFRYCGEYYDTETENVYLRNRYYDTSTGRFFTEDPIRDGLNWYVYANNNPANYIDPLGLDSYILYNPDDFSDQVASEVMRMEENFGTPVHTIKVRTEEEYIKAWNNMGNNGNPIDGVVLIFHGRPDALMIDYHNDEYLTIYSSGITQGGSDATYIGDKSKLENKTIKKLYLQSCNTGLIDYPNNISSAFINNYDIGAVISWDGGTAYTKYVYFDSNQIPQAYYHIRLANDQSAFKSWRKKRRNAQGRVMYTKNGVNVLGNPYIVNGTTISGRKIYIGPR